MAFIYQKYHTCSYNIYKSNCNVKLNFISIKVNSSVNTIEDIRDTIKKISLITAIKTPYVENGKIDIMTYDNMVETQISNGVQGLIVGGTTGEGQLMSWDEHIMLIGHTVSCFGDRIFVIGNTGSNSTKEALHATEQGFAVGMHAALLINPYYGKTSKTGLLEHFRACLSEGPAIIYNVPGRTGQDITPEIIEQIAAHDSFIGVKECAGNERLAQYTKKGITCWSGNDDEAYIARHELGAAGAISVTSNIIPGLLSSLMIKRNDDIARDLSPLFQWLFHEPNPIPLNTALAMLGIIKPVFRMPYVPTTRLKREEGVKLLERWMNYIPNYKTIDVLDDRDFLLISSF